MILSLHRTAPTSSQLDGFELYETLTSVGYDLRVCGESIRRAAAVREEPTEHILRTARAAIERARAALAEFEAVQAPLTTTMGA